MLNRTKLILATKYILSLIVSVIVFLFIMIIKRHTFPSTIVYYEGIYIALIYFSILYLSLSNIFTIEKCIIGFLICFNFWALVPTIIDRSVSITVLGSLRNQQLDFEEVNSNFINKYVYKNSAVKKRLVEQVSNGNIILDSNNYYTLTNKGLFTAKTVELMAKIFNVNDDFILPE